MLTLIMATLTNPPTYSLFMASSKAAALLEKLYRNFLWGGSKDEKGFYFYFYFYIIYIYIPAYAHFD